MHKKLLVIKISVWGSISVFKLVPTCFHENPKTNPEFPQLHILTNLDEKTNDKKQKM